MRWGSEPRKYQTRTESAPVSSASGHRKMRRTNDLSAWSDKNLSAADLVFFVAMRLLSSILPSSVILRPFPPLIISLRAVYLSDRRRRRRRGRGREGGTRNRSALAMLASSPSLPNGCRCMNAEMDGRAVQKYIPPSSDGGRTVLPLTSKWRLPLPFSEKLREAEKLPHSKSDVGIGSAEHRYESGGRVGGWRGSCLRPIYLSTLPGYAPGSTAAGAAVVEGD